MKTRKYFIVLGFLCALYSCEDELVQIGDDQIQYNDHLIPLVTTFCDGYCHATANYFATYDNIKEAVDSGELWRHVVVDQTMPLYGSGLQITESR